jgi:hypothetical protein
VALIPACSPRPQDAPLKGPKAGYKQADLPFFYHASNFFYHASDFFLPREQFFELWFFCHARLFSTIKFFSCVKGKFLGKSEFLG